MYETILIPIDGSGGGERALEEGLSLAREFDATVHVVYAVERIYGAEIDVQQVMNALEDEGERVTAEAARRAESAGVDVVTAVRHGSPHTAILDYLDEHGVDLVVMGTHGRTGVDRLLLGSVTERVVRHSPVPVLTVRASE